MPIVQFHLVEGQTDTQQQAELLREASRVYAQAFDAPIERIRAFITEHPASGFATAGEVSAVDNRHAPFFEFFAMAGRPLEQRHRVMGLFTDLLVEHLGVKREDVRGICHNVSPEDWAIAGEPASVTRAKELAERAEAAKAR